MNLGKISIGKFISNVVECNTLSTLHHAQASSNKSLDKNKKGEISPPYYCLNMMCALLKILHVTRVLHAIRFTY